MRIETRDRFDINEVVDERSLTRFRDYNIDYDAGTILFKSPVPSQDENLNPVYIVVEYETDGGGGSDVDCRWPGGAQARRAPASRSGS
ncbi:MAG: hypothetical protein U5R48_08085 [Gammaproteobacteria bacterium]|nr:hypothetical protein [Gammaproteobacteria bacterium]